jgi:tetratricopeptide (TPR) repeat protein
MTVQIRADAAAQLVAMGHARNLLTSNPNVPDFIQMVSGLHLNLGNIYRDWGKSDKAESEYRDALALQRNLVKEHAKEPEYQRLLALILHNLGKLYQELDRPKDARKPYEEALQIRETLAEESIQDLQLKVDLGRTCNNLANACKRTGDRKKAEDLLKKAIHIRKDLVDKEIANAEYQTDLASSHHILGNLYGDMGKNSESEEELKAAMAIQLRLYHDQPSYINNVINLGKCCTSLSFLLIIMKRYGESVEAADQAIRIYEELLTKHSELLDVKTGLTGSYVNKATALSKLGKTMDAIKAWNSAITYDNGRNRTYLQFERSKALRDAMDFVIGLIKMGQYADGVEKAKMVAEWEPKLRPDVALAFAIASEAAAQDKQQKNEELNKLRDQYREEAMALLTASKKAGLLKEAKIIKALRNDHGFDCLRNREDFGKLVADLDQ